MPRRFLSTVRAPLFVAALIAGSADARAQAGDYALTNVRIVTAPGRVIDRGTVLIQGGRIAAVGPTVQVPAGVTTMDLSGHTVFPGLIDAATGVGLPSPNRLSARDSAMLAGRGGAGAAGAGGGRGRGAAPADPNAPPYRGVLSVGVDSLPRRSHVVTPQLDAAAEAAAVFAPSPMQLQSMRSGGVTAVGLVFQGGTFPGRVGAALTGGTNESQLALRSSIAEIAEVNTLRGTYPGTGIGALAYVKQAILDAQYEGRVDKAIKSGATGLTATSDPFLRSLIPAASNEMPIWFQASTERQIDRIVDLIKELGLRNSVIVGAQEGWRVIPALKSSGATAVVSLEWPSPAQVTGAAFTDMSIGAGGGGRGGRGGFGAATTSATPTGPGSAEILGNAAALARAGIPIVLSSFGGESGSSFRDRVRTTIASGLSADDALRATTIAPATLLGIADRVGTIEAGKLANLVVVPGNDLFSTAPIKHVFVQGRLY